MYYRRAQKLCNCGIMDLVPEKYRSLSAEEAQKVGQQLYRSRNYQEALSAFTAVSCSSDES